MGDFISERQMQRLLEVGLAACHRGKVAQGRAVFEGLLAADPGCIPARIGRAFSHLVVNDFNKAEDLLKNDILAQHPNDVEARALLAFNYQLAGRAGEAEVLYRQLAGESGPAALMARAALEAGA